MNQKGIKLTLGGILELNSTLGNVLDFNLSSGSELGRNGRGMVHGSKNSCLISIHISCNFIAVEC